jgi:hypothetical protein
MINWGLPHSCEERDESLRRTQSQLRFLIDNPAVSAAVKHLHVFPHAQCLPSDPVLPCLPNLQSIYILPYIMPLDDICISRESTFEVVEHWLTDAPVHACHFLREQWPESNTLINYQNFDYQWGVSASINAPPTTLCYPPPYKGWDGKTQQWPSAATPEVVIAVR